MKSLTISGSKYTVTGTVRNQADNEGVADLRVLVYDQDIAIDDFLGIGVTNKEGVFEVTFDASKFESLFDWWPDLYFVVQDGGFELLNTENQARKDMKPDSAPIDLLVDLSKSKLREEINKEPVEGWVGGFADTLPKINRWSSEPDISTLPMLDNLDNIDKLDRQQKVLWPEFSWNTELGGGKSTCCYQMFAPDISRLGYTNEGRVFSIICPQQGASLSRLGRMNIEVTVTGNRGWVDEEKRAFAADMGVEGKIWFAPSAKEGKIVKLLLKHFRKSGAPFPSSKADAIVIKTHKPGFPDEPIFPLIKGSMEHIPKFTEHEDIAWDVGHLDAEIGDIVKTGNEMVDEFNQLVVDLFNVGAGNMLQKGNILSWNVWFTAPELVDRDEWKEHAEVWRKSLNADHGSPEGPGTEPRYFDGTPFKVSDTFLTDDLSDIIDFIKKHL